MQWKAKVTNETAIELGDLVVDKITNYKGVAVAHTHYLSACDRFLVQSRELFQGVPVAAQSFDIHDLTLLEKDVVGIQAEQYGKPIPPEEKPGGPGDPVPLPQSPTR